MTIEKILVDYTNITKIEKNISISLLGYRYNICILPRLNSKNGFISIYQDGEPLVINRAISIDEPLISLNNSYSNGLIDFVITYDKAYIVDNVFDINRLGKDLFLYYIRVDEDEI